MTNHSLSAVLTCLCLCRLCAFASAKVDPSPPGNLTRVMLADPAARCLDGSPAAFYFTHGVGGGARKWLVWHEGKAWCLSHEDCLARTKAPDGRGGWKASGGSCLPPTLARSWPEGPQYANNSQQLSADPAVNPTFFNWNIVFVKTCDGGSLTGNRSDPVTYQGQQLYYRGHAILQATIDELERRGIGSATDVVIGGGSAGALAAYLNVQSYAKRINPQGEKRFSCLPDGGFFMDLNDKGYHDGMVWMQSKEGMQSVLDPLCAAHYEGMPELCMFAPHLAPFIKTDLFVLQAKFDAWQVRNILGSSDPAVVNAFGANMTALLKSNVLHRPGNAAFIDACFHHTGGRDQYVVDGFSESQAFDLWYRNGSSVLPGNGQLIDDSQYPCTSCCGVPSAGTHVLPVIDWVAV